VRLVGKILLGCSGWHYKDWVGPFYRTEKESKLAAYTKIFETAEIDSTFYAYPSKGTVMGWAKYTKPAFVFTAKLPRLITHKKMLDPKLGVEEDLQRFCELMRPLQLDGKLRCLLIQCPPGLKLDLALLEGFFKILPSEFRFAIEFRDLSWLRDETWRLLKQYEVAYTIVDEPLLPPEVKVTTDIAYLRWHGRGRRPWYNYRYKIEELEPWIPRVKETANTAKTVYGYFNNHYHGYAVENCLQVLEMLGMLTPQQQEAKNAVAEYFETEVEAKPTMKPLALTTFMPEKVEEMSLQKLLQGFMDPPRFKRATRIKDQEVSIQEATDKQVKALIREYHVLIDLQNRTVLHDCADWSRCIPVKQFCKHVGKILMSLPGEKAVQIMRKIYLEREEWEFKPYVS